MDTGRLAMGKRIFHLEVERDRLQIERDGRMKKLQVQRIKIEAWLENMQLQRLQIDSARLKIYRDRLALEIEERKASIEEIKQNILDFAELAKKFMLVIFINSSCSGMFVNLADLI